MRHFVASSLRSSNTSVHHIALYTYIFYLNTVSTVKRSQIKAIRNFIAIVATIAAAADDDSTTLYTHFDQKQFFECYSNAITPNATNHNIRFPFGLHVNCFSLVIIHHLSLSSVNPHIITKYMCIYTSIYSVHMYCQM